MLINIVNIANNVYIYIQCIISIININLLSKLDIAIVWRSYDRTSHNVLRETGKIKYIIHSITFSYSSFAFTIDRTIWLYGKTVYFLLMIIWAVLFLRSLFHKYNGFPMLMFGSRLWALDSNVCIFFSDYSCNVHWTLSSIDIHAITLR